MKSAEKFFPTALFLIAVLALTSHAQVHPSSITIPVTYYDFHSDRSNPEFECPHKGGLRTGMVALSLDDEGKPTVGPSPYINQYVKYWFRDWANGGGKGDSTKPLYDPSLKVKERFNGNEFDVNVSFVRNETVTHDTAFKNVVIPGELLFTHSGGGIYTYDKTSFFPIDGQGFGNEWTADNGVTGDHNYSFTMEMVWSFKMEPGLQFTFRGDDDVWLFVNNRLVMDLGGIHGPEYGSVNLDTVPGLEVGQIYDFRFFYAERHTTGSSIRIETNLIAYYPDSVQILVPPDTAIKAGTTLKAKAVVMTDSGAITNPSGQFTWGLIDQFNAPTTLQTVGTVGDSIHFSPTLAYTTVKVWVRYYDPSAQRMVMDTVSIRVIPGDPDAVSIEAAIPDTSNLADAKLRGAVPLDTVRISSTQNSTSDFYAVLRDQYGNYCYPAGPPSATATWSSAQTDIAIAKNGAQVALGQGLAERGGQSGTTTINVSAQVGSSTFSDDVAIRVNNITYTALQLGVMVNGEFKKIDTLILSSNTDTTIVAIGQRSDNGEWEPASMQLRAGGMSFSPAPSGGEISSWTFHCNDRGEGWAQGSVQGAVSQQLVIIARLGPASMAFYDKPGSPENLIPLPDRDTIRAGDTISIYAKLFDGSGKWLNDFESADSLRNRITWRVTRSTDAFFGPTTGNMSRFSSIVANQTYTVTATYSHLGIIVSHSMDIHVLPGEPVSLDIQKDSVVANLYDKDDFKDYYFAKTENNLVIWAVTRDKYGNYVGHATQAQWQSTNNEFADVSGRAGSSALVTKKLNYAVDQMYIIVSQDGLTPDTLKMNSLGENSLTAGPNPFIPNVTPISSFLSQEGMNFYSNVIGEQSKGLLIGVESPKPFKKDGRTGKIGKVVIYDAVGNVVASSRVELKQAKAANTYGAVWDGKNEKGRIVGPGVYLLRISAEQVDGKPYLKQKKLGVAR